MNPLAGAFGILTVLAIILGLVLTILWIILPFAVFGIKNRMDKLLHHLDTMNRNIIDLGGKLDQIQKAIEEPHSEP